MGGQGYKRPRMSTGMYFGDKAVAYVLPVIVFVGSMLAALILHFTLGNDPKWMGITGVMFTVATGSVWRTWSTRRKDTRVMATVLIGLTFGWILIAASVKPWHPDILKFWVVGGFTGVMVWWMRHAGIAGGHEKDASTEENGNPILSKIAAFKNATMGKAKETADELRFKVRLGDSNTAKDAQQAREQVAAVSGVDADAVKIFKTKGHEGMVDIAFTRPSDIEQSIRYTGPSAEGKSIQDAPLYLGGRADGSSLEWWLCGDWKPGIPPAKERRQLSHTKVTGTPGSGKTTTLKTAILDLRFRIDAVPIVVDASKFQQGFGDIEDVLGMTVKTLKGAKRFMSNLNRAITYRAGLFGSLTRADGKTGYIEWCSELYIQHGIPLLAVDLEELADYAATKGDALYDVARKARSVGIHLIGSMQTMPHDDIDRKTRGMFAQSLAHGQNEAQDARYSLSAETREAGADPTKWKNDHAGCLYGELVGSDKSSWSVDARALSMSEEEIEWAKQESQQYWAEIDHGTLEILSSGLAEAEAGDTVPLHLVDGEDDDEFEEGDREDMYEEASQAVAERADGVDLDAPLERRSRGGHGSLRSGERVKLSTEEARARFEECINMMERSNQTEVRRKDLVHLLEVTGRAPNWLYLELDRLEKAGRLERIPPPPGEDGKVYTILPALEQSA